MCLLHARYKLGTRLLCTSYAHPAPLLRQLPTSLRCHIRPTYDAISAYDAISGLLATACPVLSSLGLLPGGGSKLGPRDGSNGRVAVSGGGGPERRGGAGEARCRVVARK
eukprot:3453240-Rhodomonas_salina.1